MEYSPCQQGEGDYKRPAIFYRDWVLENLVGRMRKRGNLKFSRWRPWRRFSLEMYDNLQW